MALWIEIRCAALSFGVQSEHCLDGVGELTDQSAKSAATSLRDLKRAVRLSGWVNSKEGLVCPHCIELVAKAGVQS